MSPWEFEYYVVVFADSIFSARAPAVLRTFLAECFAIHHQVKCNAEQTSIQFEMTTINEQNGTVTRTNTTLGPGRTSKQAPARNRRMNDAVHDNPTREKTLIVKTVHIRRIPTRKSSSCRGEEKVEIDKEGTLE
jgi:hypothetical protein